jgi:peptide-methionine (S)-S-oxide reductase
MSYNLKKATLGGGCFWCVEAIFQDVQGIAKLESGYAGGHVPNPTYRAVCNGTTGHAEVIQLTYDPDQISFEDILYIFWRTHDPTTLNRQGADVGSQYRSVVNPAVPDCKWRHCASFPRGLWHKPEDFSAATRHDIRYTPACE